jgi:phosphate transport system substrate-binding protein
MPSVPYRLAVASSMLLVVSLGCGKSGETQQGGKKSVRVEGSDTMVNVAQAWAERYGQIRPDVSVQVLGNGSGVGIASLIAGNCDLADASREMTKTEIARAKAGRGADPKEIVVGHDALAIYVHKDNPLESISMEDLAEIYGEEGKITKWSQLGVHGALGEQPITRVSRQSSSGTYMYFREKVLGPNRDYKLQSIDQSGSKDVVALVARTPSAIGYSGMGYKTPEVKMLKVSPRSGQPGVAPTIENARNHSYPITRSLLIYVIDEPAGIVKEYLDWIRGPEGQKIVSEQGYVPN